MRASCVVVLAVSPCLGCFSTWDLGPKDLHTLRSFEATRSAVAMHDVDGKRFTFDEDTKLIFEHERPGDWARPEARRFSSIYMVDSYSLSGFDHGRNQVTVDLTDVDRVKAANFSAGKTVAWSLGVTFGVAAVVGIGLLVLDVAFSGGGGEWPSGGSGGWLYAGSAPFDIKERRGAGIGLVPGGGGTWSRSR